MKNFEETLKGLYRDLRNQRLLPVVVILLIAIVVVPMALGSGGKQAPPQTQLAVGIEPLVDTQPVVLPATPELRNFHKRLNKFAQKNPFHQPQPIPVKKTGSGNGGGTAATSDTTATGSTTGTSTAPTDTGTTPTDTGSTTGTTGTTGTGSTGSTDTGSTNTGGTSSSGAQVLTYEIDVLIGAVGQEKEMDGVKSLEFLPGGTHPVLQYVTTDLGGNHAAFVVSNGVTSAEGDGRCAPNPNDCEFLQLSKGDSEKLVYGPTARTYRIKLLGITQKIDPLQAASNAAGAVSGRIGFSAGLSDEPSQPTVPGTPADPVAPSDG